jgi:hypothetical protein
VPQTHFGGRSARYGDRRSVQSWPATGVQFTAGANTRYSPYCGTRLLSRSCMSRSFNPTLVDGLSSPQIVSAKRSRHPLRRRTARRPDNVPSASHVQFGQRDVARQELSST